MSLDNKLVPLSVNQHMAVILLSILLIIKRECFLILKYRYYYLYIDLFKMYFNFTDTDCSTISLYPLDIPLGEGSSLQVYVTPTRQTTSI